MLSSIVDLDIDEIDRARLFDAERGRRLAMAMSRSQCKRAELAHLCETSERQITRYRAGYPISPKCRKIICRRCEISEHYLLYGDARGLSADTSAGEMLTINHVPVHRLHVNLLRHLRSLPESEQVARPWTV